MRRSRSWNRGSERSGLKTGFAQIDTVPTSCPIRGLAFKVSREFQSILQEWSQSAGHSR
jgi:hypothetical protein